MDRKKLERLAVEKSYPCITISMNTHRTHPDNAGDVVVLNNLLKEAETRLIEEYGKDADPVLLKSLRELSSGIDENYHLNSLHIFLSRCTKEIIRSEWPTPQNVVHISEKFSIRPLIKSYNRAEEYLILLLSRSEAHLYRANNEEITEEIRSDNFPFDSEGENLPNKRDNKEHLVDGKREDNLILEFFNKIDKAVMKVHNRTNLNCIVISTDDNYSRYMQIADKPSVYLGNVNINKKEISNHKISGPAWQKVREFQQQRRDKAIRELQDAAAKDKVLTDLRDIFVAAKEGRGELLVCHEDFHQAVRMNGELSFDMVEDPRAPGVIDDITSDIAREVISKNGKVIFTESDEIMQLGKILLKVRF